MTNDTQDLHAGRVVKLVGHKSNKRQRQNITSFFKSSRNPGDPSIQITPTLGHKACKYDLHWAIWIPRRIRSTENVNTVVERLRY